MSILARNASFRSLWIGQLVCALGDRLTQMGILTYVMLISGDGGGSMSLITFASLLPFLVLGPLFGVMADRHSRKALMIASDVMRALLVLFIPWLWMATHSVALMLAWFFMLGSLSALFAPAKMSILGSIVAKDEMLGANSLIAGTGMTATLVGTLLAGWAIRMTGIRPAFYLNAAAYLVSALLIVRIAVKKDAGRAVRPGFREEFGQGIAYMRSHRRLLQLAVLACLFSLVSSVAYIIILNYGTRVLALDSLGMGLLISAAGFGMITGAAVIFKRNARVNFERCLYLSWLIIGAFLAPFFLAPGMKLSMLLLFCAGAGAAVFHITLDTVVLRITPDELKGKIMAVRGVAENGCFLAGTLAAGSLVRFHGSPFLFGLLGVFALCVGARIYTHERRWGYHLLRVSVGAVLKLAFRFRVTGTENLPTARKVILAGNHTSLLDGILVACAYPRRVYFMAADTAFTVQPWGWIMRRLGYIPVKRGGFNKEAIRQAVAVLKAGYALGIFPEGKLSADGRLEEGKAGISLIARLADADIVPLAIEGAYEAWHPKKGMKPFPVEVRFGKPLDPGAYEAAQELADGVMAEIAEVKLELEREGYLRVEPDEIVKHLINLQ